MEIIQTTRLTAGVNELSEDMLWKTAEVWEQRTKDVPINYLSQAADLADENRKTIKPLQPQEVLQAWRMLLSSGAVAPSDKQVGCPDCNFTGWRGPVDAFGYVVDSPRQELILRDRETKLSTDAEEEGYRYVRPCKCLAVPYIAPSESDHTQDVSRLMRILAGYGDMEQADRQQAAAFWLLKNGYSLDEIIECSEWLREVNQRADWVNVRNVIGFRFFRDEISRLTGGKTLSDLARLAIRVVQAPMSLEEMIAEHQERKRKRIEMAAKVGIQHEEAEACD